MRDHFLGASFLFGGGSSTQPSRLGGLIDRFRGPSTRPSK
jgi:hypothetical protein